MILSVQQVTKKYRRFTALEDITVSFEPGIYGLLAPNGAGKTTLIKMLTTLLFPTAGKITLDGQEIVSLGAEYRGMLGYLPQDFGYYRSNTPRQFLKYIAALQGVERRTAAERAEKLLDLVGLSRAADMRMSRFSGGMLQRVGIAQALINDPGILILDEPTAGLDPGERVRFRNLIHGLAKDRIIILSTHIVSDLDTIAGRILMLKDHHLLYNETPSELKARFAGKIFEVPAGAWDGREGRVLAEKETGEGTVLRIMTENAPDGAVPQTPTLEDVYLCIYENGMSAQS